MIVPLTNLDPVIVVFAMSAATIVPSNILALVTAPSLMSEVLTN